MYYKHLKFGGNGENQGDPDQLHVRRMQGLQIGIITINSYEIRKQCNLSFNTSRDPLRYFFEINE